MRERIELFGKTVSGIMLTLLLIGMLTLAFNVQPVKASGTVYIRTDGSIDPPTAPIQRDGDVYIFTNNINDSIVIERDNILLDGRGYTLGPGNLYAIQVSERTNVTIKRINIQLSSSNVGIYLDWSSHNSILENSITGSDWTFDCIILDSSSDNTISGNSINGCGTDLGSGVHLYSSSNNTISENSIISNSLGIFLEDFSSNNTVSGNNITTNSYYDIYLYRSSSNTVYGNNITANSWGGISLYECANNNIVGNNITINYYSRIYLNSSSNNKFYHNNFINNGFQFYSEDSANVWDDGYPSGGNYWSDYNGTDLYRGSYQNETGSDGIGDTPYTINSNNRDNYPLTKPYPWNSHDIGVRYIGEVWETYLQPIIIPLKTNIGLGFKLHINIFVMNYGAYSEVFNVTVYANTTVIGTITNVTLASRNSAILNLTWDTTSVAKGNYTISAYASPVQGETDTKDNLLTNGQVRVATSGDVDGDGIVTMKDIYTELVLRFMRKPGDLDYSANSDINDDGIINYQDIYIAILHFMQTDP